MIEYEDGRISEPIELEEAIRQFKADEKIVALHRGSSVVSQSTQLKKRIAALEKKVKELEPVSSELLYLPTVREIALLVKCEEAQR